MKISSPVREAAWIELDLRAMQDNMAAIRGRLPQDCAFMAVLKADGYGHGLQATARAATEAGADAIAVGTLREGLLLRESGIRLPILVLTPSDPDKAELAAECQISLPVFSAEGLEEMQNSRRSGRRLNVHLKFDTGMGRFGIRDERELARLLPMLQSGKFALEGVYTHLAAANQADTGFVREQLERFARMRRLVEAAGFTGFIAHFANSAAAIRFPGQALDMVRVGASLFGITPIDGQEAGTPEVPLRPTFSLHTRIVHVKRIECGESVGYDRSYIADSDQWIATLPIGYADGWSRRCRGMPALVNGQWAYGVGNVCMNQTLIRLSEYVPVGTPVTLIGVNGGQSIALREVAEAMGTISQEVLTSLGNRLPRLYT
ncbi:alanine racemase [Paenibacillus hodogayensis]|uniref:Alanine racemase n=1 Tax=Paenibacillus hodogayensis TaxID=279208 RepID=A0ABV5VS43_9BACL